MNDVRCPNGCGALERLMMPYGTAWECLRCKGRSMGVAVLRKSSAPKVVSALWGLARDGHASKGIPCVHCTQRTARVAMSMSELADKQPAPVTPPPRPSLYQMLEDEKAEQPRVSGPGIGEPVDTREPSLEMDICLRCHVLWLETCQLASMPAPVEPIEAPEQELPEEAKKMLAIQLANQATRRLNQSLSEKEGMARQWVDVDDVVGGVLGVFFWGLG